MTAFNTSHTKLAALAFVSACVLSALPASAEVKKNDIQCAPTIAASTMHHSAHRTHTLSAVRNAPDELEGISQHYVQAAVEHLGRDEAAVLKTPDYRMWATGYDAVAKDHICANKAAIDSNTHLLRGCLTRFYDAQRS